MLRFLPFLLAPIALFGQNVNVRIPAGLPPNAPEKAGWNLVLQDEFDGQVLKAEYWSPRDTGDEAQWCVPMFDGADFAYRPQNVTVGEGLCRLAFDTAGTDPECAFTAAEISTTGGRSNPRFSEYRIHPNVFIEVRAKLPRGHGIGSAGWLWVGDPASGRWHEIDLWECFGEKPGRDHFYQTNLHYGKMGPDGAHKSDAEFMRLYDLHGKPLRYDAEWLTFGLEWLGDGTIRWYLNNVLVREENIIRRDKHQFSPMLLRFTMANSLAYSGDNKISDETDFPKSLLLDYVRIYQKEGFPLTHLIGGGPMRYVLDKPEQGGTTIKLNHWPGAAYRWSAGALAVHDKPPYFNAWGANEHWFPYQNPRLGNRCYPVQVSVTTPTGYTETLSFPIWVAPDRSRVLSASEKEFPPLLLAFGLRFGAGIELGFASRHQK